MAFNSSCGTENHIEHADQPLFGNQKDAGMTTRKIVIISIMTTSNVFMLLGNSFSVCIIMCSRTLRRHTYYWLVLNLAVLDLLNSLFVVPINIVWEFYGNWPFTQFLCNTEIFFDLGFGIVATYSTVLLSMDKYLYIARPFLYYTYMGPKATVTNILAIWVVWMTYSAVSVFGDLARSTKAYKYEFPLDDCNFVLKHTYVITSFVLVFLIPMVILIFTSTRILCVARQHFRRIRDNNNLPNMVTASHDSTDASPKRESSASEDFFNLSKTSQNDPKSLNKQETIINNNAVHATNVTVRQTQQPENTISASRATASKEILPGASMKNKNNPNKPQVRKNTAAKRTSRAFGTVILVVVFFVIMFAPYWIASVINVACVCIHPMVIENYLAVFYYMHSLVNPYIYMATDRRYKKAIRQLLAKCGWHKRCKRSSVSPNISVISTNHIT